MASYDDFSDIQIVVSNTNIGSYDPRPKASYDDFSDMQVQAESFSFYEDVASAYDAEQSDNNYLFIEVDTDTFIAASDIELNPKGLERLETVLGTDSEYTIQELIDLASSDENVTVYLYGDSETEMRYVGVQVGEEFINVGTLTEIS